MLRGFALHGFTDLQKEIVCAASTLNMQANRKYFTSVWVYRDQRKVRMLHSANYVTSVKT
eukprot:m.1449917 g.1449917  ORF g.1449917 m.1449917 type:complete len:60 (-) comp25115_c1_seq17:4722-4901(-)